MAPLCKFFQQGNCRNGTSCRFEHPGAAANPFAVSNTANNRFNALGNAAGRAPDGTQNAYSIKKDAIRLDLTDERPGWILSSFGPGKDAPEQLFGGPLREQSVEEMMVYVRGASNQQQAMQEVTGLYNQADQQIKDTLNNLDGAVQFILAAENNHPNRLDICKQNTREGGTNGVFARKTGFADSPPTTNPGANQNPFSTNAQPGAFGQPSALGQQPSAFGAPSAPAFGQPSQMSAAPSAFGKPSQMGAAAPAFGQPSQMGTTTPAFGQTSQMGAGGSAFGQPSQMGAGGSAFGQPSQMGAAAPAFGQTSALGQKPNPFSAAGPSAFGQIAGQGGFGQSEKPNPFGAPAPASASPFAQAGTSAAPNPFGQAAPSTASPFAQPAAANPFSQPSATSNDQSMDTSAPEPAPNNPFSQQSQTNTSSNAQASNPFGQAKPGFAANAPFGQQSSAQTRPAQAPSGPAGKNNPYPPGSTKQHPAPDTYINKDMSGRILAFKNQPVSYKWKVDDKYQDEMPQPPQEPPVPGIRKPDGTWSKILFPDGPPPYYKDTEPDPSQYDTRIREAYSKMALTGQFRGDMPEVPPMREDCEWAF